MSKIVTFGAYTSRAEAEALVKESGSGRVVR